MSALAEGTLDAAQGDRLARRNALVLAVTQALAGGNNTVILATSGIVGSMIAPDKGLATLPISVYVFGLWLGTMPMGLLARRYGRRTAFQLATISGVLTGLICCYAVLHGSFLLFNIGTCCGGFYAAGHMAYRFAAADTASEAFRPKAISWVLAGGVFAGVVGPQVVIFTKDMWPPYLFAATYIAQAGLAVLAAAVLCFVKIPKPKPHAEGQGGRPLGEIARQPRFIVAVICGVTSYAMMNMVMTAAPLAMVLCNHSVTDATFGLQWHVMAMFAPSFFTGSLILRFGVERVVGVGLVLLVVSAVVSMAGTSLWHFYIGLILIGLGWNFGFIGATQMVTETHRPEERNRVQSFNDFLVFGTMAVGSFSSGKMLAEFGWATVNGVVLPVVLVAGVLLARHALLRRRAQVAA
jgi:MFS family permease